MRETIPAHSLLDLSMSHPAIDVITATDALRAGHWLVYSVPVSDTRKLHGLFVREEDVEQAAAIWPMAFVNDPNNSMLKAMPRA